jgi:hypothetical protein
MLEMSFFDFLLCGNKRKKGKKKHQKGKPSDVLFCDKSFDFIVCKPLLCVFTFVSFRVSA